MIIVETTRHAALFWQRHEADKNSIGSGRAVQPVLAYLKKTTDVKGKRELPRRLDGRSREAIDERAVGAGDAGPRVLGIHRFLSARVVGPSKKVIGSAGLSGNRLGLIQPVDHVFLNLMLHLRCSKLCEDNSVSNKKYTK